MEVGRAFPEGPDSWRLSPPEDFRVTLISSLALQVPSYSSRENSDALDEGGSSLDLEASRRSTL